MIRKKVLVLGIFLIFFLSISSKAQATDTPCKRNGESGCSVKSDCCNWLTCAKNSSGIGTCIIAPIPTGAPIQCIKNGEGGCLTDSQCCAGLTCLLNDYEMYGSCGIPLTPTPSPSSLFGKAVKFSGEEAIIFTPTKEVNLKAPFTVEAWVKPEKEIGTAASVISTKYLVNKDPNKCYVELHLYMTYGSTSNSYNVVASLISNGSEITDYSVHGNSYYGNIPLNQWSHLALTYDSNNVFSLFINGNVINTGNFPLECTTLPDLVIGGQDPNLKFSKSRYIGEIDEVRVSNSLRYSSNFYVPQKPFVADQQTPFLWHLDGNTVNSGSVPYAVVVQGSLKYVESTVSYPIVTPISCLPKGAYCPAGQYNCCAGLTCPGSCQVPLSLTLSSGWNFLTWKDEWETRIENELPSKCKFVSHYNSYQFEIDDLNLSSSRNLIPGETYFVYCQ